MRARGARHGKGGGDGLRGKDKQQGDLIDFDQSKRGLQDDHDPNDIGQRCTNKPRRREAEGSIGRDAGGCGQHGRRQSGQDVPLSTLFVTILGR
jgi:hypothetical protein